MYVWMSQHVCVCVHTCVCVCVCERERERLISSPHLPLQGCPFLMDIYSEQCEAELEIVDVLQCSDTVDPALSKLGVAKGVSGELKGCDDSSVMGHAYTLPHWAMIVVENKVRCEGRQDSVCCTTPGGGAAASNSDV